MDVADFLSGSPLESSPARLKRHIAMPPLPPPKKPNLSWKRRKDELHRLRAETQALETRLTFLKLKRTRYIMMKAGVGLSAERKRWRDAVESEKRRCKAAREENKQLKDKLESCFKASHDLQTVVAVAGRQQHNMLMANTLAAASLQAKMRAEQLLQLRSDVLIGLENRMNKRLAKLECRFRDARACIGSPDIDQVNVHREGVEGSSAAVDFKRNRFIPFDAGRTSCVIWNIMLSGVIPDNQCIRVTKLSDDTLVSQGSHVVPLKSGGTLDLRVTCMMKRVVFRGGFIALIESTSEWQARPCQAKAWTHVTKDSGWALVLPTGPQSATCQLQLAVRIQTDVSDENTPSLLTPSVSDVVIPSFREILSSRHQLVENALFDSMRSASSR
ncbi:unnamed protein product [Phytophthora lilii]|uniref:Unnamed protein product n=1 Tax=Phytophthora lilii TaxID=2077276 RepID=A0A9W6WTX3_9STRA|nr:unnamed protein product [Phytophthora lilii]